MADCTTIPPVAGPSRLRALSCAVDRLWREAMTIEDDAVETIAAALYLVARGAAVQPSSQSEV